MAVGLVGGIRLCAFGQGLMGELLRGGIYQTGIAPLAGDSLVIETDAGPGDFTLHEVRGRILCEEHHEAGSRECWFDDVRDLKWHPLSRSGLYQVIGNDLGLSGATSETAPGIWELGRKNIPGQGRACIFFVERGVSEATVCACLARVGFKLNALLYHGEPLAQVSVPGKEVVYSRIEVAGGIYVSDMLEDLPAARPESMPATGIERDASPPQLVVRGEVFELPVDRGRPVDGVRYLEYLFDHPREAISCWDLERQVNPALDAKVPTALGADEVMDSKYAAALKNEILEAEAEVCEVKHDSNATEAEIMDSVRRLDALRARQKQDTALHGKSRLLGSSDHAKARRRVRKALQRICESLKGQNPEVAVAMAQALGEGKDVYFNPPPEWGV